MKKTRDTAALNDTGPLIRQARLKAKGGVSQDDLAGRLSVMGIHLDRSAISRIENQERGILDYELIAIARSLKVSPIDLFPKA